MKKKEGERKFKTIPETPLGTSSQPNFTLSYQDSLSTNHFDSLAPWDTFNKNSVKITDISSSSLLQRSYRSPDSSLSLTFRSKDLLSTSQTHFTSPQFGSSNLRIWFIHLFFFFFLFCYVHCGVLHIHSVSEPWSLSLTSSVTPSPFFPYLIFFFFTFYSLF